MSPHVYSPCLGFATSLLLFYVVLCSVWIQSSAPDPTLLFFLLRSSCCRFSSESLLTASAQFNITNILPPAPLHNPAELAAFRPTAQQNKSCLLWRQPSLQNTTVKLRRRPTQISYIYQVLICSGISSPSFSTLVVDGITCESPPLPLPLARARASPGSLGS